MTPMTVNYRMIFAKKKRNEERIKKLCPDIQPRPGIYLFYRISEQGFKNCYVGQATTNLLQRTASHLDGFDTYIDKSIRKHGLYDAVKNPFGYKLKILCYCSKEECNQKEVDYIKQYADEGWQLKNVTGGSQGEGKFGINENKSSKGYYEGIARGRVKTLKEIRVFFDKYLDYSIKGKPNKIKERKLLEFGELLKGDGDEPNSLTDTNSD